MPEPLKRKKKDGTPYERPPEIEALLEKLEVVNSSERLHQFETISKNNSGYVPSEVLIYFLRRAWVEGAKSDFEVIFRILMKRIENSLRSTISDSRKTDAHGIREEITGRFVERIAKDCKGNSTYLDFFEIRFDKALSAFKISALRQIGPTNVETVPLESEHDDGLEISAEVESAAADFLNGNSSILDDPDFRLELTAAIDTLPDDQKRVIGLIMQGFQIDSKDKNIMTISRILKCDERTVRNRRDRALKQLKTILQKEDVYE